MKLNPSQEKAVLHTEGPLLVIAGAGSGKTRVLTARIEYMIKEKNINPKNILAITFTNKAANEMKRRLEEKINLNGMWVSTFHSFCTRVLRRHIDKIGYNNSFVIYDATDQRNLLKECYSDLEIDEKSMPVKSVLARINKAKDELISAAAFKISNFEYRLTKVAEIYELYEKKLKSYGALDFNDLISKTIFLFDNIPEVLEYYQEQFKYILIDEYQDTNTAQYILVDMLAKKYKNLCVVGDDDQSIYKFRGADIKNILTFEHHFKNAVCIKLEQNYRSSQNILDAANFVISNNAGRKGKLLWTDNEKGEKVCLFHAKDEYEEAKFIAGEILKLNDKEHTAILYRMNAISGIIEEQLIKHGIKYKIYGGLKFYDRKEIKDVVAYLRIILNPGDNLSLKRIINEPKRGIGNATVEKFEEIAAYEETSLYSAMKTHSTHKKLNAFLNMIDYLREQEDLMISEMIVELLERSGYKKHLEEDDEAKNRLFNINELISIVRNFEQTNESPTLLNFLQEVSLSSDIDNMEEKQVSLMTIHSAKGLEFNNVFLCGLEEGIFPSSQSFNDPNEIEEERRLCYVGITRARKKLYITASKSRYVYRERVEQKISRFLDEIPPEYIEKLKSNSSSYYKKKGDFNHDIPKNKPAVTLNDNSYERVIDKLKVKPVLSTDFKAGDLVMHKKFGEGMILSIENKKNDVSIEISFKSFGTKTLSATFAKLERI